MKLLWEKRYNEPRTSFMYRFSEPGVRDRSNACTRMDLCDVEIKLCVDGGVL